MFRRLFPGIILSLLTLHPEAANAVPVDGNWGITASPVTVGLEGEVDWKGSPFGISTRLGAMGYVYPRSTELDLTANGNWWTTWAHYTQKLTSNSSAGLLAGVSQSWFFNGEPIPFRTQYSSKQPLKTVFGAFYEYKKDWFRVRFSPSFTVVTPPNPSYPTFDFWEGAMLGPPLVELGFMLNKDTELNLRPSITPVSLNWGF